MIKLEIGDHKAFEQEYFDFIKIELLRRIICAKKALNFLDGKQPDIESGEIDFIKTVTRVIINKIDNNFDYKKYSLNQNEFTKTLSHVVSNYNLSSLKLRPAIRLFDYLHEINLQKLIICEPEHLADKQKRILKKFKLLNSNSNYQIKLAFNYKEHSISNKVSEYFKNKNITFNCPYCNLNDTKHREDNNGQTITTHELDHFFDKANNPLLCYSLYNLVPSCTTCNRTNKGMIQFSNEYHLNPYIDGFGDDFVFRAIRDKHSEYGVLIDYESKLETGSNRYKRILGDSVDPEKGNVNVFKIMTKYEDEGRQASHVVNQIEAYNNGYFQSIRKYLNRLKVDKIAVIKWYEEVLNTPFDAINFHEAKYSKLNKDIFNQLYKVPAQIKGTSCFERLLSSVMNFIKNLWSFIKHIFVK